MVNELNEFDETKLADPVSSWEVKDVPEGYPKGKLLPPDKQLHDRHVKKLQKFLKKVSTDTEILNASRITLALLAAFRGTSEREAPQRRLGEERGDRSLSADPWFEALGQCLRIASEWPSRGWMNTLA